MSSAPTPAPRQFLVTPGPHLRVSDSTAHIMWWVNLALAPAAVWGAVAFGLAALLVTVLSLPTWTPELGPKSFGPH